MTDPIDYSRPVGWWCPVCTRIALLPNGTTAVLGSCCFVAPPRGIIPVYLPIPEGQRPPAASEVEEAEVVTGFQWGGWWIRPNPQTDSGWHTGITDALIDEITGATE